MTEPAATPQPARVPPVAARIPLLLDVDTGIDDSLALLYACGSPEAELVAVTCVGGNVDARQVAENTRAVLDLAGRDDVEVALGRETPLVRPLVTTPETHGPKGIGYAMLPPARRPLSERHAADLIVAEARRRPGELTLVTLGPATNLAVAVLREPELPLLLRRWVLMGGSYRSPGNTAPTTEWNVSVDPDAAKVAIAAFGDPAVVARRTAAGLPGLPLALGLDVTERAKLLPDHVTALARRAGSRPDPTRDEAAGSVATHKVVRYVDDALRFYMEFHSRYDGFYGAFIHDPLAVAAALDPALVRTEELAVDVELGGTLTTGETVTDWRRVWGRPPTLAIAVDADIATFFERFVERVGRLAARIGPG
ncbi:MAG: nucleoside hydrolase [Chloroflexota bacterium]